MLFQFANGWTLLNQIFDWYLQLEELNINKGISGGKMGKKDVIDDPINIQRREKVKDAMIHAWSSYEKYAWGNDELQVRCSVD